MDPLVSYEEALQRILAHVEPLPSEEIELMHAFGRVLAEEVKADGDIPSFARSMMDGYAVRSADVASASSSHPVALSVVGEVQAGSQWVRPVASGTAVQIMTGAPVPEGADAVIPQEWVKQSERNIFVLKSLAVRENVAPQGDDVKFGQLVVPRGVTVGAAEMGMLAQVGKAEVEVYQRPRVSILATGNELVDVFEHPKGAQIRNSNGYSLWGQTVEAGASPYLLGVASDDEASLKGKLTQGLEESEVLVVVGGMSVGKHDLAKGILQRLGVKTDFWRVSIKPGKPFLYGKRDRVHVFGLPGNPVSAMVTFAIFVKPALRKMMGVPTPVSPMIKGHLTQPIKSAPGRLEFMRVRATWEGDHYRVTPTGPQGSGILRSMVEANGLALIPSEVSELATGAGVEVMWL